MGLGVGQGLEARCRAQSMPRKEAEGGLLVPERGPLCDPRSCLSPSCGGSDPRALPSHGPPLPQGHSASHSMCPTC